MWGTRPLTERYNNPGALEYQSWMEKYGARLGPNGRYAAFDSPDAGYGVMSKVLDTYQNKHGLNTVAGIVNRWAPSSVDNNSTGTYTQKVAAALGVDPNAPLSPEQRPALMRAMASYESGRAAPSPKGASPASNGQQPMRNPWLGLNWPTDGNAQAGDLNPGMTPGSLLAARLGAAGMFDQVLPEGMSGGHASGGQAMPSSAEMSRAVAGNVSRETSSEGKPSLLDTILERAQSPAFQGGMMMFLDAARGGSGIDGYRAGVSGGASMQETMMKDMALKQKVAQQKAVKDLLARGEGMQGVPQPLLDIARATGDPSAVTAMLSRAGGTDDIKEFEYAVRGGFDGTFQQWMEKKKSMAGEYAKQLVYGQNEAGDVIPMQAGSKGDLKASGLPPGVKMQRDPIKFDAGTHFVLMDPTTRQPIATIPKNVDEVARQKEAGGLQGKAQGDLPAMESLGTDIIKKIEAVSADKNLDKMIGYRGYLPNVTPEARTLASKIEQLKGQAFLQAFQSLKGAGAITEMEGAKATAAMARMQEMVQSGQDYREALADFKSEVQRLMDVKRAQARGGRPAPAESVVPKQGETTAKRLRFNPATGDLE